MACIRYPGTGLPWVMTTNSHIEWVPPDACTLPTVEQPLRVAEFDRFFADSVHEARRPARTRLELRLAAGAEPTGRDLAERESACCSFFTFTFAPGTQGTTMRVEVPEAHIDVLDALTARVVAAMDR